MPKRELTEKEIERRRLKNRKRRAKRRERMKQLRRERDFNEDGTPKAPECTCNVYMYCFILFYLLYNSVKRRN